MFTGLSLVNVLGVPWTCLLDQHFGWRSMFRATFGSIRLSRSISGNFATSDGVAVDIKFLANDGQLRLVGQSAETA
jgi:hypothetical protein